MSRMLVTPEQALLWLSKNYKNRPLNESVVAEYERKIRAGEWRERGGIPIIITPSGELRNGQHRLTALVRAGCPLVLQVCVHDDRRRADFEAKQQPCGLLAQENKT